MKTCTFFSIILGLHFFNCGYVLVHHYRNFVEYISLVQAMFHGWIYSKSIISLEVKVHELHTTWEKNKNPITQPWRTHYCPFQDLMNLINIIKLHSRPTVNYILIFAQAQTSRRSLTTLASVPMKPQPSTAMGVKTDHALGVGEMLNSSLSACYDVLWHCMTNSSKSWLHVWKEACVHLYSYQIWPCWGENGEKSFTFYFFHFI